MGYDNDPLGLQAAAYEQGQEYVLQELRNLKKRIQKGEHRSWSTDDSEEDLITEYGYEYADAEVIKWIDAIVKESEQ